jgi:hypothetical protein
LADQSSQEKLFGKYQELSLLVIAFVFTSILGGRISDHLQTRAWTHQHLVQICETEHDARSKGFAQISDRMDTRLLRMRQLAWQLETAHSLNDVAEQRAKNRDARDDWASHLNSTLSFTETYFGSEARGELESAITGGFGNIHEEFNDVFKNGRVNPEKARKIESDIDALNPTIYFFDSEIQKKIAGDVRSCEVQP